MIREGSLRPPESFLHSERVVNFECRRGLRPSLVPSRYGCFRAEDYLRPPLPVVNLFSFFLSPTLKSGEIMTSACSLVFSRVPIWTWISQFKRRPRTPFYYSRFLNAHRSGWLSIGFRNLEYISKSINPFLDFSQEAAGRGMLGMRTPRSALNLKIYAFFTHICHIFNFSSPDTCAGISTASTLKYLREVRVGMRDCLPSFSYILR